MSKESEVGRKEDIKKKRKKHKITVFYRTVRNNTQLFSHGESPAENFCVHNPTNINTFLWQ